MSFAMWRDPYLLGFMNFTANFFIKIETGQNIKPIDTGFAMTDAFTTVSNMNGRMILEVAVNLAEARDPFYMAGMYDATTVTLYSVGLLKDEDQDPLVIESTKDAEFFGSILPDTDFRSSVAGAMIEKTFINRVKEMQRGIYA